MYQVEVGLTIRKASGEQVVEVGQTANFLGLTKVLFLDLEDLLKEELLVGGADFEV